ncbi:MAG TPA: TetR/AcrR family transcriptional regulator [Gemmatimonadaceae bacterium]|nr:TetR/AcrR family transcriptional regulator [Gemmatimonadaceae bacterium]
MPRAQKAPARRRAPEARPAQILEAALDVFAEKGLADARIDDIAERAGIAKGTIYLYFPTKDDLFRAVIRGTVVAELERAEVARTASPHGLGLESFLTAYWRFICSPTFERVHRFLVADLPNFPDLARFYADEVTLRGHRLVAALVQRGIEQRLYRDVDPSAAARIIMSIFVMHGVLRTKRHNLPHIAALSDEQLFDQMLDFVRAALGASHS